MSDPSIDPDLKERSMAPKGGSHPLSPSLAQALEVANVILLVLGAGLVLLPLGAMLLNSLAPAGATLGQGLGPYLSQFLVKGLSWENYQEAWLRGNFPRAFANSTLVALAVTACQVVTSAFAGYALARFKFVGRQAVLLIFVATLVIPFQMLVIPIFLVLKWGHLINTYGALILPTAVNGFGIFLLRQFFLTIPIELEEAAVLDGASRLEVLWQILIPLARPALVTLFLFTFIGEWNDLFKPLIFTTRPELTTVQLALASFQEQFTSSWALLMAAVVIATLPVVLLFLIGQRQFIRGIAMTGLK